LETADPHLVSPVSCVLAWLGANALAISFDVEAERELARTLRVQAVPTIIAFRQGMERSRLRGLRHWMVLFMWLDGLGREPVDVGVGPMGNAEGVEGRMTAASALLRSGEYAEAAEHYVWLWNNMARVEPDQEHVRVSFLASEVDALVCAWPQAHERFSKIRDEAAGVTVAEPGPMESWMDWVVLNSVLGQDDRTIAWFDAAKADPGTRSIISAVSRALIQPLKLRGRWADLGLLYRNPLQELAFQHEISTVAASLGPEVLNAELSAKAEDVSTSQFRAEAADLCRSLQAAGRSREAREVRDEARRLDPSEEMRRALESVLVPYN
jgi:hypothetical protein